MPEISLDIDQWVFRKLEAIATRKRITVADAIASLLSEGVTNLPVRRTLQTPRKRAARKV